MSESASNAAESALHGATAGAREAAFELIDVLFGWLVPLITLIVGYLMSAAIGLSGAIGTLIDSVLGAAGVGQTTMCYIAVAFAVLIWGAIAGGLWAASGSKSIPKEGKWILRPIATLFAGFALGEVPAGFAGKVNNGALGKIAATS